jgi:amidase
VTERALLELAAQHRLDLAPADVPTYRAHVEQFVATLERLHALADDVPEARARGTPPGANPLNAWAWRCNIAGPDGPLAGRRIAIKDNICVAGVPMRVGSSMLDGYVPRFDAPLVERLLGAGATIAGKSECEALCFSSGSHTAVSGPVRNPHDPARSAGGSSGGSAVLVATGEVDLAIGTDSAGSIRTPSSYCGVYGLKPTAGLVPTDGIFPLERTLDCAGPIARTLADLALVLDAIADAPPPRGTGLRIGLLREGFGWPSSEPDVDEAVRAVLGERVEPVTIPLHRDGVDIWASIAMEGAYETIIRGHGGGTNTRTWSDPEMIRTLAGASLDLSPSATLMVLSGALAAQAGSAHYAVARRLARRLARAYDEALADFDVLAMPTNPMKPPPLPASDAPLEVRIARSTEPILNTCPFNVTGHPALSAPWARAGALPVGVMLVGRRHGERDLLRVAAALEQR